MTHRSADWQATRQGSYQGRYQRGFEGHHGRKKRVSFNAKELCGKPIARVGTDTATRMISNTGKHSTLYSSRAIRYKGQVSHMVSKGDKNLDVEACKVGS